MQLIDTESIPWKPVAVNARVGAVESKFVREGELLPGVGFTADCYNYVGGEAIFTAPRHRHDFEQIRISMSGRQDFGRGQILEENWIAYFPAGAFYGPEEIDGASIFQIQWSDYWVTRAMHEEAYAELNEKGDFDGGKYRNLDESGQQIERDALNAIWEHVYQRPSAIPTPRYPDPILINPDAFDYLKVSPTHSTKVLGRLTERDLMMMKVRWEQDGCWELPADRTYCMFTTAGEIQAGGATYGVHTVVWSDAGERESIDGREGAEALVVGWPTMQFAPIRSASSSE
jgi:hypothetical protein